MNNAFFIDHKLGVPFLLQPVLQFQFFFNLPNAALPERLAVFDVADSEAGIGVQANVAGAEAPWSCRADRSGRVQGVMYTGSEGAL